MVLKGSGEEVMRYLTEGNKRGAETARPGLKRVEAVMREGGGGEQRYLDRCG